MNQIHFCELVTIFFINIFVNWLQFIILLWAASNAMWTTGLPEP